MSLTVVVGGQLGSEAKGKVVSYLARTSEPPASVVRTGGPNAGHTAMVPGRSMALRQLPSGALDGRSKLYLAAGMVIDVPLLLSEIEAVGVTPERLVIDPQAALLDESDRAAEHAGDMNARFGSTLSGTGSTTARKVLRDPSLRLAQDAPELAPYLGDVAGLLNATYDAGGHIIIEGTQGFGLSLHHSGVWPFTTSRDTTAGEFLSEAGLSPRLVTDIILALRTYPIRVAGNSGPLPNEIDWPTLTRLAGSPVPLSEQTTVTKRTRRVAHFDWAMARRAALLNRPTGLAVHGLDYLNYADFSKTSFDDLSENSRRFIFALEKELDTPAVLLFTGPQAEHLIDRRQLP